MTVPDRPLPADWFLPVGTRSATTDPNGPAEEALTRADHARGAPHPRPPASYWAGVWSRYCRNRPALVGLVVLGALVLAVLVGPYLTRFPYDQLNLLHQNLPPGPEHLFGTDQLGRDVFARTWMGGRLSLLIGLAAAAIDLGIGAVYGGIAGFAGGWLDEAMMRLVDILYGIPFLLVVILLLVVLGSGLRSIIVAIALVNWLGMARLVRGQVLQLKEQDYVLASRVLGVSGWQVIRRHLLPGALPSMLAWIAYNVPAAIFAEAFLSYIGLGVQPPLASWGGMLGDGFGLFRLNPWPFFFPAAAISLTMLAFYLISDGLRDALGPQWGSGPSIPRGGAVGPMQEARAASVVPPSGPGGGVVRWRS